MTNTFLSYAFLQTERT